MKKSTFVLFTSVLSLLSASAFAAPNCNDYIAGANKTIAKYISTPSVAVFPHFYFNKEGKFTLEHDGAHEAFTIAPYTIPAAIMKKVYFRFIDAATKGTRIANGRLVCTFRAEFSDGYVFSTKVENFDVEPFTDTSKVSMVYSPNEQFGGQQFSAGGVVQFIIESAAVRSIVNSAEYKANMAKFN